MEPTQQLLIYRLGSALTMKIQYYQIVHEDEASFLAVLPSVLADMHLLPQSMRKLDCP